MSPAGVSMKMRVTNTVKCFVGIPSRLRVRILYIEIFQIVGVDAHSIFIEKLLAYKKEYSVC